MMRDVTLKIEGMDCPSCAVPIEKAVSALPGVANARINYGNGKIRFQLDADGSDETMVIKTIKKLGYKITANEGDKRPAPPKSWYQTPKGKLVLFTGIMLVLATLVFILERDVSIAFAGITIRIYEIGYAVAALVALTPMAGKAGRMARAGSPFTIETLVTLAVIGAIAIRQPAEAAVVVFLFAVGEMLEGMAAARARKNVHALADLAPKTAFLVQGETVTEVMADTLSVNDIVEIRPGGRVPADGVITRGSTSLDESSITGESIPVRRGVGDAVYAGTINTDGVIQLHVNKTSADNMIARIMNLVEEAEAGKSPTARFIDNFSHYYTPGVLVVSILIATVPPLFFGGLWMAWLYKGLAILLIGCPCALVLSTPAAITSGIAAGARRGLLIKGGVVLEAIGKVKIIAFDKTGTLTEGSPKVTDIHVFEGGEADMMAAAAGVEATSSHPLAMAIMATVTERGIEVIRAEQARALNGRGVEGRVGKNLITVASPRYAAEITNISDSAHSLFLDLEAQGKTLAIVIRNQIMLGVIALRDELRADAGQAMARLRDMKIKTVMLTGDNGRTGTALAAELGMEVRAELMPADKLQAIENLKQTGRVAMVGDGINDAPALASADVGVAMGGGTDVALETADAALLREQVSGIPALVSLSRATLRNIYQNIGFALILKAIFLVTTLLGATSLWMAILADTGATVIVTLNALRLLRYDPYTSTSG